MRIKIYRDEAGEIRAFAGKGHTGFAQCGEDIVCAAVSVLLQTAVVGLRQVAGVELQLDMDDGGLSCRLLTEPDAGMMVHGILETMALGLRAIARDYSDYVQVMETEL